MFHVRFLVNRAWEKVGSGEKCLVWLSLQYHSVHTQMELLTSDISLYEVKDSWDAEVIGWEPSLSSSFINCTCTQTTRSITYEKATHARIMGPCTGWRVTHTLDELAFSHFRKPLLSLSFGGGKVSTARKVGVQQSVWRRAVENLHKEEKETLCIEFQSCTIYIHINIHGKPNIIWAHTLS